MNGANRVLKFARGVVTGSAMGIVAVIGVTTGAAFAQDSDSATWSQYQQMMAAQEQDTLVLGGPAQQPRQQQAPQPAYQQPPAAYNQSYQYPAYQAPAYQQPAYQQPAYQQPAYQQPAYQQPTYQQPVAQQPAYQQPAYQQPAQQPAAEPMVNDLNDSGFDESDRGILAIAGGSTLGLILLGVLLIL